jgi:aspartate ammonia-lyase
MIIMAKAQSKRAFRIERDSLGEKEIPAEALYGV